jgi:hypothetical protein
VRDTRACCCLVAGQCEMHGTAAAVPSKCESAFMMNLAVCLAIPSLPWASKSVSCKVGCCDASGRGALCCQPRCHMPCGG